MVAMWQRKTRHRETIRTRLTVVEMDTSTDLGCDLEVESIRRNALDLGEKGKRK